MTSGTPVDRPPVPADSLSIIVPTHNTRALTLKCLGAIDRAFRRVPIEVVLVDDGSSDGTEKEVRAAFSWVRVVRHDVPRGFSAAVNAGLRTASHSVLMLLNSDTEVDQQALDAMLEAFGRDPRLGIAGAQLRYPSGEPQWSGGAAPGPLWLFYQASGLHPLLARLPGYRRARPLETAKTRDVGWVTGAALAMRREVWNQVGPFDEGFQFYGQDLDLCLRAGAAGWRVSIVPAFTVMHHHGATIGHVAEVTARQDPAVMWHDLLYWTRKHGGETSVRRARRAIRCGGWLRVLARRVVAPAMPSASRPDWRRQTAVLRSAIRSLRRPDPL